MAPTPAPPAPGGGDQDPEFLESLHLSEAGMDAAERLGDAAEVSLPEKLPLATVAGTTDEAPPIGENAR